MLVSSNQGDIYYFARFLLEHVAPVDIAYTYMYVVL